MFTPNESTLDRVIRFVLGAVLVYVWYAVLVTGALGILAVVVGIVLMLTGIVGWCPIYKLLGSGTRQAQV